jgi:hypothetical protein
MSLTLDRNKIIMILDTAKLLSGSTMIRSSTGTTLILMLMTGLVVLAKAPGAKAGPKSLSDEDILNPKKLIFNRTVPLTDSFDGSPVGMVFISKRVILGNPKNGVIGEPGSPSYREACLLFCPTGTSEIDATYVYVLEKKGECTIGIRAIGWGEFNDQYQNYRYTGTQRVRFTSSPKNINFIRVNGIELSPLPGQKIEPPHGSNYKYFPRNKTFLGQATTDDGFITDVIYFDGQPLVQAAASGTLEISYPYWQPSRHLIQGRELGELQKLLSRCQS